MRAMIAMKQATPAMMIAMTMDVERSVGDDCDEKINLVFDRAQLCKSLSESMVMRGILSL